MWGVRGAALLCRLRGLALRVGRAGRVWELGGEGLDGAWMQDAAASLPLPVSVLQIAHETLEQVPSSDFEVQQVLSVVDTHERHVVELACALVEAQHSTRPFGRVLVEGDDLLCETPHLCHLLGCWGVS